MLNILSCQLGFKTADLAFNTNLVIQKIKLAKQKNIDLVIFPELFLTGYFCMDRFLDDEFILSQDFYLNKIALETENITVVLGFVNYDKKSKNPDQSLKKYNSAIVFQNQQIIKIIDKKNLPNYDVFYESRYFSPSLNSAKNDFFEIKKNTKKYKIGVQICEDLWDQNYQNKPTLELSKSQPDLILNLSSSPFWQDKDMQRKMVLYEKIEKFKIPFIYLNSVGSFDAYKGWLVLDGASLLADLKKTFEFEKFLNQDLFCKFDKDQKEFTEIQSLQNSSPALEILNSNITNQKSLEPSESELLDKIKAIVLTIFEYFTSSKLKKIIIGLSGGIDSSLVATLACLAVGNQNILGVFIPSQFSSNKSQQDAEKLAKNLAIEYQEIDIKNILQSYEKNLNIDQNSISYQNLQARVRANLLMFLANQKKGLVLATSNKTEISFGYSTLYGDSVGGLSPIADLDKQEVYQISKFLNKYYKAVIPTSVLRKPASAELSFDQTDEKSLGASYQTLVALSNFVVLNNLDLDDKKIIQKISQKFNLEENLCLKLLNLIKNNEFKRRQIPDGIKLTEKSFGSGRRLKL
jgi:NAD+ synthase (glutamine-hydrolysing)